MKYFQQSYLLKAMTQVALYETLLDHLWFIVHGSCVQNHLQSTCMIHSPSTRPSCFKQFHKSLHDSTIVWDDWYELYWWQCNCITSTRNYRFVYDNCCVVPYNTHLSWRYQARINDKVCVSVQVIKYIHKYIYKGSDHASHQLQETNNANKVKRHLHGYYIGPCDAIWRMFEFRKREEFPTVYYLCIYLPGEQPVYFAEDLSCDEL